MNNDFYTNTYNPDVLSCLANLSNDEVFTPPEIVNQMLDMLPKELWYDKNATFLEPACKSGVFLREIAKRLIDGLVEEIPDLVKRIDHIYKKQLYGIAITELTSLLSRRSLYCSKFPNSKYSVTAFDDAGGNIRFKKLQHRWINGRCVFCGASQGQFGDEIREGLETHAYEFIHTTNPEELFSMKFDVIIGNPPYQLSDGGNAASAIPIYQKFVNQAQRLKPRYLCMVIPSRWFTGGRGLDSFRKEMLNDDRIRVIHDYPNATDCFPGVEIKGGICYFLWDRDHRGTCLIFSHNGNKYVSESERPLLENGMSTFLRYNEQISILRKVANKNETLFSDIVSANDPFGFDVRVDNSYRRVKPQYKLKPFTDSVDFYYFGWKKEGLGYIDRSTLRKGLNLVDKYKILVPAAWGSGDPNTDWVQPFVAGPNSCATETYLTIGSFDERQTAENVISYIQTKFFHALVSMIKITHHAMQKVYSLVPIQDFTKSWTDVELYTKYGLTEEEIAFIESMIRPMDLSGGDDNG